MLPARVGAVYKTMTVFGQMLVSFLWPVVAFFILVGRFTVVMHTVEMCCMRYTTVAQCIIQSSVVS